ncbi:MULTISPECIES: hypothetical protein [Amycolatopsis]|uniref:hypothetical protein n=1 Tax=Amycolatopsis TaxID=1813 RepID=UPI000B050841|nr:MULTISPECIES: hypothetical protein [Amycolatopsis]
MTAGFSCAVDGSGALCVRLEERVAVQCGPDLPVGVGRLRAQDRAGTEAFVHYDLAATRLAPFGAWLFHRARMREPLGRHDGVASARRAHSDTVLLSAAQAAGMATFFFEATRYTNPLCAAMRPVVGLGPPLTGEVLRALGPVLKAR